MGLPRKNLLTRLVASVFCLLALTVYIMFAPAKINAASCTCGGGMEDLCAAPGQRCVCLYQNLQCWKCVYKEDPTCPCVGRCVGGGPGGT